jgi:hypothetical protein
LATRAIAVASRSWDLDFDAGLALALVVGFPVASLGFWAGFAFRRGFGFRAGFALVFDFGFDLDVRRGFVTVARLRQSRSATCANAWRSKKTGASRFAEEPWQLGAWHLVSPR